MSLRQLLFLVFAATALLWGGWAWTIWTIDPQATNWIGFLLFYAILFMALLGTGSMLGIIVRHKRDPEALVYDLVSTAFRQSFLLSLLAIILLALQGQRLMRWYFVLAGFILIVSAELFFAYRDSRHRLRQNAKRGANPSFIASSAPSPTFTKRII